MGESFQEVLSRLAQFSIPTINQPCSKQKEPKKNDECWWTYHWLTTTWRRAWCEEFDQILLIQPNMSLDHLYDHGDSGLTEWMALQEDWEALLYDTVYFLAVLKESLWVCSEEIILLLSVEMLSSRCRHCQIVIHRHLE